MSEADFDAMTAFLRTLEVVSIEHEHHNQSGFGMDIRIFDLLCKFEFCVPSRGSRFEWIICRSDGDEVIVKGSSADPDAVLRDFNASFVEFVHKTGVMIMDAVKGEIERLMIDCNGVCISEDQISNSGVLIRFNYQGQDDECHECRVMLRISPGGAAGIFQCNWTIFNSSDSVIEEGGCSSEEPFIYSFQPSFLDFLIKLDRRMSLMSAIQRIDEVLSMHLEFIS